MQPPIACGWRSSETISYRDRLKIDWNKRFDDYLPRFLAASNAEEFAQVAVEFLSVAQDAHIWLKNGDRTIATHPLDLLPNANPQLLRQLVPQLDRQGTTVGVGGWPDGIRYLAIATWEDRDPTGMAAAVDAVKDATEVQAPIVVDVRFNSGGDERLARQVAAFFVDEPTPYAQHIVRAAGKDFPPQVRVLNPDPTGLYHPGSCVVLMGP